MNTHITPPQKTNESSCEKCLDLDTGIHTLVEYFQSGSKGPDDFKLGFELEQIIVDENSYSVPYCTKLTVGQCSECAGRSVSDILAQLSKHYDTEIRALSQDSESPLLGLSRKDAIITLEPGAQFEYSSQPFWRIEDLDQDFKDFQSELLAVTSSFGYRPLTIGYHPKTSVYDINLLPKERYQMMNQHFKKTGKHGINMMRGTASTQVTIDYSSESDAITKMRVAAALTPLLSLLTDNTPRFENSPVEGFIKRTEIWNDVDPDRSMIIPGLFDRDYSFAAYAKTALTAPIILFDESAKGGALSYGGQKGACETYDMSNLIIPEIEHILSMLFFDVRLRQYVEIRTADSMPFEYAKAYVALIKGLFYDKENLGALAALYARFTQDCIPAVKSALIKDGYGADISYWYGTDVQDILLGLIARARAGLARIDKESDGCEESTMLDLFEDLVKNKTTLAKRAILNLGGE